MHIYKRQMIVAGAALLTCLASAPASADVRTGIQAWEKGNYEAAVKEWRRLAEKGDADARFNMGQAYRLGRGVPADLVIARAFYQQAAAQGHHQAQANLGLILYESGDRAGALPWLRKAADNGDARSQYVLGTLLFNGDIVGKDPVRAYALLTSAARQGLPFASRNIEEMEKYISAEEKQQGLELAAKLDKDRIALASASTPVIGSLPKPGKPAAPVTIAAKAEPRPVITAKAAPAAPAAGKTRTKVAAKAPGSVPAVAKTETQVTATAPKQWPVPTVSTWSGTKATPGVQPSKVVPKSGTPEAKSAAAAAQTAKLAAPAAKASLASPGGRWRVQLGAFPSQQAARAQWGKLSAKMSVLAGREPAYEPYQAFTRLRVGPLGGKAEANKICAAAKAAGQACFAVAP